MPEVDEKVCDAKHKLVDKVQSDQHELITEVFNKLEKLTGKFDKIYVAIIIALIAVIFDFIRGLVVLSKVSNHVP